MFKNLFANETLVRFCKSYDKSSSKTLRKKFLDLCKLLKNQVTKNFFWPKSDLLRLLTKPSIYTLNIYSYLVDSYFVWKVLRAHPYFAQFHNKKNISKISARLKDTKQNWKNILARVSQVQTQQLLEYCKKIRPANITSFMSSVNGLS